MAPQGKLSQDQVSKAQVAGNRQVRAGGRSPRESGAPPCRAGRAEPVWTGRWLLGPLHESGVLRPPRGTCCFLTRADASRGPHTGRPAGQERTPAFRVRGPAPQPQLQVLLKLRGRPGLEKRMPAFQNLEEKATGWFLSYLCYQKLNKLKKAR